MADLAATAAAVVLGGLLDRRARAGRAGLGAADVRCSWSGLRPVIASGDGRRPSDERREHLVLAAQGVVGLSGGKLTTFAAMAEAALRAAAPWLPPLESLKPLKPLHGPLLPPAADGVWGDRLGPALRGGESLGGTPLAAIRHSLQHEQVRHLDDLLLRRTRLGLLQPGFAAALLPALLAYGLISSRRAALWRVQAVPAYLIAALVVLAVVILAILVIKAVGGSVRGMMLNQVQV